MKRSGGSAPSCCREPTWNSRNPHPVARDERDSLSVEPGDAVAAGFNQKGNHAEITAEQPLINKSVCCTRGSGIGEAAADPSDYPL